MKMFTLKNSLAAMAFLLGPVLVSAQFDDVYYNPDHPDPYGHASYTPGTTGETYSEDGVTYYDDDDYEYFDDYDFYYSSRIKRFHRHYDGFDFYDPIYTSYYYYDPFYSDAYYYPGSTIYVHIGGFDYWEYRRWQRWNRWNSWNNYYGWNSWCVTPFTYYYAYNNWYGGCHNHYWSGYNNYYPYSSYYNNYYSNCPFPVGYNNGITNVTVHHINSGGTRDTYYGPRFSGNTGSSPRGPVTRPGDVQPVLEGGGLTDSNDKPVRVEPSSVTPGRINPGGTEQSPGVTRDTRSGQDDGVKQSPVDRELKRDEVSPSRRPVFRPDPDRYQPYPKNDKPRQDQGQKLNDERPVYKPYTPDRTQETNPRDQSSPTPGTERPTYTPRQDDTKPSYRPSDRQPDRPRYTPSQRDQERPSYTPPGRNAEQNRSSDRPSYTPSRSQDSGKSNDRSGYSPSRNDSSSRSNSSSSRSESSSSRSSSSHSSGGQSSGGSPRGRG